MTLCDLCKEPVDPDHRQTYYKVQGWSRRRDQGGTNALYLQESLGEYAHKACVDLVKRGISVNQGTLY